MGRASLFVCCPSCGSHHVANHGKTKTGKQRYNCLQADCLMKTFILDDSDCVAPIKQPVFDKTINSDGMAVVLRALGITPNILLNDIKKRTLH